MLPRILRNLGFLCRSSRRLAGIRWATMDEIADDFKRRYPR